MDSKIYLLSSYLFCLKKQNILIILIIIIFEINISYLSREGTGPSSTRVFINNLEKHCLLIIK